MIRQGYYTNTFIIKKFVITLERLNNNIYGNPRYRAFITRIEKGKNKTCSCQFTFTGHYYGEYKEALFILNHYLENAYKDDKMTRSDKITYNFINKELKK